jgi:hypothetical protein
MMHGEETWTWILADIGTLTVAEMKFLKRKEAKDKKKKTRNTNREFEEVCIRRHIR